MIGLRNKGNRNAFRLDQNVSFKLGALVNNNSIELIKILNNKLPHLISVKQNLDF